MPRETRATHRPPCGRKRPRTIRARGAPPVRKNFRIATIPARREPQPDAAEMRRVRGDSGRGEDRRGGRVGADAAGDDRGDGEDQRADRPPGFSGSRPDRANAGTGGGTGRPRTARTRRIEGTWSKEALGGRGASNPVVRASRPTIEARTAKAAIRPRSTGRGSEAVRAGGSRASGRAPRVRHHARRQGPDREAEESEDRRPLPGERSARPCSVQAGFRSGSVPVLDAVREEPR